MRSTRICIVVLLTTLSLPLVAQEPKPDLAQRGDFWLKKLTDRGKRTMLQNAGQNVRGDSGRWNDNDQLLHAPPIENKPMEMSLDDWADQLREKDFQLTRSDDNWLLFLSKQLDDNDRLWIERIERRGTRITVVANRAVWQGKYFRNFTYYPVVGVNLGELQPGKYQVKWVIEPFVFNKFEGDGRPRGNWSNDERPSGKKPVVLSVAFVVVDAQ